jgi:trehalose 6-phosphate synthase
MYSYYDLKEFFKRQDIRLIMVADAETRVHERKNDKLTVKIPAGGVSVAMDPIMKAAGGVYIGRGKTEADREVLDRNSKMQVEADDGEYTLKRVFSPKEEEDAYYFGFSNQTMWPLCHVAFDRAFYGQK